MTRNRPNMCDNDMQSEAEPDDFEAAWAPYRRSSPDPSAPSTHILPVRLLISLTTYLVLILVLLAVIPYTIARYAIRGAPFSWMPLLTYIQTRLVYWSGRIVDSAQLPPAPTGQPAVPGNLPLRWAKEGRRDVDVEIVELTPIGEEYRKGVGRVEGVEAEKRWGYMLSPPHRTVKADEIASEDEKVVLYFHGGAYASGHPVQYPFPWQMAKALNVRLLGVQYRLCLDTSTAFPAPLLDALSGYLYLVRTLRVRPRHIILMGDSSGGHLALALSRYIHDLKISQPGFIALTSSLGDCLRSLHSRRLHAGVDILAPNMDKLPLKSALRHYNITSASRGPLVAYFSPAKSEGRDWEYLRQSATRVYIMVGTKEILLDDSLGIVQALKDGGVDVTLQEDLDGFHCGPLAQWKGSKAWDIWIDDLRGMLGDRAPAGSDDA